MSSLRCRYLVTNNLETPYQLSVDQNQFREFFWTEVRQAFICNCTNLAGTFQYTALDYAVST
jgi:hypothetical protein